MPGSKGGEQGGGGSSFDPPDLVVSESHSPANHLAPLLAPEVPGGAGLLANGSQSRRKAH